MKESKSLTFGGPLWENMQLVTTTMTDEDNEIFRVTELMPRQIRIKLNHDLDQSPAYRSLDVIFIPTNQIIVSITDDPSSPLFGYNMIDGETSVTAAFNAIINHNWVGLPLSYPPA